MMLKSSKVKHLLSGLWRLKDVQESEEQKSNARERNGAY